MEAGLFTLFICLFSYMGCLLLVSVFQRDCETVNFNSLFRPRHYDDLPAHKEVCSRTWKLCAPSRISAEVYEVSSAFPKPLDMHTFLCELSILSSWQPIYLNCLKTKLSPFPLSPTLLWHMHIMIIFPSNSLTCL